ncbi:hypothetical protein EPN15_04525 [Patescibacteria group bacterium]|nr:MAG: hypothetical protein EPN15_04525 [Patescibacteria group bacterium]
MRLSKEQLIQKIKQTLKQVGTSQMSQSTYDLGWLLRLPNRENPQKPSYPQIISWLENLQHKDGSWGGQIPFAHDRVISTLSVIAGASHWPLDEKWRGRIAKAVKAVEIYSKKLLKEPEATVAFELLFSKLLNDCENLGIKIKFPARVLNHYLNLKKEKLSKLPIEAAAKYPTTLLHALEALDENKTDLRIFEKFQSPGGSFGCSPAATAFMLSRGIGGKKAERYLNILVKKKVVPVLWPMEIFERAWSLFPLFVLGIDQHFTKQIAPHLKYLRREWTKNGISLGKDFLVPDLDDTVIAFYLLNASGARIDSGFLKYFSTPDGLACYPGERGGSFGSHYVNFLFALPFLDFDKNNYSVEAVGDILKASVKKGFWNDKWHISPFYASCRFVLAAARDQTRSAVLSKITSRIYKKKNKNNLWGAGNGTVEETAYALISLLKQKNVKNDFNNAVKKGFEALSRSANVDGNYSEMWVGKSLFVPANIVRITIFSALLFYEENKSQFR